MNEKTIQKRLRNTTILITIASILLIICGSVISNFLQNSLRTVSQEQMKAEADEYKNRILKQIDADFQSVNTLSSFIEYSYTVDLEHFAERLDEANRNNDFLTMAYFPKDGNGVIATLGQAVETGVPLSSLAPESIGVIENAWEGEQTVSRLFESEISHERVFAYGVPVYDNGVIIGALAVSDHVEIFSDILVGNTVFGGNGYIHMVGSEGKFLIRSSESIVQEEMNTIFDGPYISQENRDVTKNAMLNQKEFSSTFRYQNSFYQFLLEPVGVNGWYLLCVNTAQDSDSTIYHIVQVTQITFIAVILLAVFLILYGYRLLRKNNKELIRLAYHDTLTGANNLIRFRQKLQGALEKSGGSVAAVNVRQFTFIGEIFGKEQANQLLCYMRKVMERHLALDEFCCRDSADWFYLFLKDTSPEAVGARMSALMDEISSISKASRSNYQLVLYCGVAISEPNKDPAQEADRLMTKVLFALDKAKGAHQNNIWFYDAELHKTEELENYVESHMHQALQDREFKLFLQPKIDLKTNRLGGAEALVRWVTRTGKMLFPDHFIPLFERSGFCTQLDLYMVELACQQLREWIDQGIPPIPISINQSKLLFYEADYPEKLCRLIERYNIPAELITLEILEGLALENVEALNRRIELLQTKGFRISMDDFGSGYSSLNTLSKLRIDELKLDRGFLQDISNDENERAQLIMGQIVKLTKQLRITTVVEGVETQANEQMIREMGCDYGQGYYYSKPIDAQTFSAYYRNQLLNGAEGFKS